MVESSLQRYTTEVSGRVTHLKRTFSKTYIFLLPTYLVYQNLLFRIFICPPLNWQLGLKLEDRLICPTHVDNKKTQVWEKILGVLHDQSSVESL